MATLKVNKVLFLIAVALLATSAMAQVMRRNPNTAISAKEVSDRAGVYLWGQLPPADPADNGWVLVTAAKRAKALSPGLDVVRVALESCYWDPQGKPSGLPLDKLAVRPDYDTVFGMFGTVIVTTYGLSACDTTVVPNVPIVRERSMTPDELAAVRAERTRFVNVLAARHPNTRFVIANWESDHDVVADDQAAAYVAYAATWLTATRDAVTALRQSGATVNISTMVEMVYVAPLAGRQFNGLASAVTDLAPNGQPLWDYISYSSWNSMMYGVDPATNAASFAAAFVGIRAACAAAGFSCADKIVVGEVGTLRNYDALSGLLNSAMWESLRQHAQFVVNWVLADQPGEGVTVDDVFYDQSQFGKYTADGSITPQGLDFGSLYSTGIESPYATAAGTRSLAPSSAHARPRHPMDVVRH